MRYSYDILNMSIKNYLKVIHISVLKNKHQNFWKQYLIDYCLKKKNLIYLQEPQIYLTLN